MSRAGKMNPLPARMLRVVRFAFLSCTLFAVPAAAAPIGLTTEVQDLVGTTATLQFALINLDDDVNSSARVDNIRFLDDESTVLAAFELDFEGIAALMEEPAVDTSLTPTLVSLVPGAFAGVGTQQVALSEDPGLLIGTSVLEVRFDTVPAAAKWLYFEVEFDPGLPFSGNGLGPDTFTVALFDTHDNPVNTIDPNDPFNAVLLSVEGGMPPTVNEDPEVTRTFVVPEPVTGAGMLYLLGMTFLTRRVRRNAWCFQ